MPHLRHWNLWGVRSLNGRPHTTGEICPVYVSDATVEALRKDASGYRLP
jgi:hypothetical protein